MLTAELDDGPLLMRATELHRILVSQDGDMLREGSRLAGEHYLFAGVVYAHQLRVTIGRMVADLEMIAKATSPEEWLNRIEYLPLD